MFTKEEGSNIKMSNVLQISTNMGVNSNTKKMREFVMEQKYLGFIWNGFDKTVCLPEEKLKEQVELINKLLVNNTRWSKNKAKKVIGKMNHLTYILPTLKCHM